MMAKDHTQLIVRQQPTRAQVVQENNPKNRKPIDPPPIIELKYDDRNDHNNAQWLVSPRTFMMVTLINVKEGEEHMPGKYLIGQTVSSLHRLKDINNKDGGFFVFGDISAKKLGMYKLRFSLFDTDKDTEQVVFMKAVDSEPFPVVPQRDFGSMSESTHLTRTFSDQGVKLRVRKDNRAISGIGTKRPYQASPPETSSPSTNTLYGGAVQDHYGSSMQSPVVKRQRSSSEYGGSFYSSLPHTDSSLSHYSSTLPSTGQRTYGGDHQHIHGYGQQSPLGPPTMGRSVQTPSQSSYHQHLPSPTPSMTNSQHLSFPGASSQQGTYSYGEPGATGSMSSVPRNPYFAYQPQTTYQTPSSSDLSQPYPGINMAVTSVADASSLAAPNSQPFGISPYETGDEAGPYGSYDNARYG